jgi:cytochrome c2
MFRLTRARCCLVMLCWAIGGCERSPQRGVLDGDVANGRLLLRQFGCGACHVIPGVATAQGQVGPPLGGVANRVYLAGSLPNSPEAMLKFIRAPQAVSPRTIMPDLGVGEAHGRDMVAFLYTLK